MTWRSHTKSESFICKLYFIDISIEFSKDTVKSKEVLVYFITFLMNHPAMKEVMTSSEYHKKLFFSCMDRILNSKYISNEYKEELRRRLAKLDYLRP